MSEEQLADFFPPVHASDAVKTELSPLQTKADDGMLFIVASITLVSVCLIALACIWVAVSR
jgi:hypothetical protein